MRKYLFAALTAFLLPVFSHAQIITTIAGSTTSVGGDGFPATDTYLGILAAIALDNAGNIYITDLSNRKIRKVNTEGIISTIAGNGTPGFSGDGGPATAAEFGTLAGMAVDASGNVYVTDLFENTIRKIDTFGIINTIAGGGGATASGIPATSAVLGSPAGIFIDDSGNVYFAESGADDIRKIDKAGIITTVAGKRGAGIDSGDNGPAINAGINAPYAITFDKAGNMYIGEEYGFATRKISPSGIITTIAGTGLGGPAGNGGPATAASLTFTKGIAADTNGNVLISEPGSNWVQLIDKHGIIKAICGTGVAGYTGDGGPAALAKLAVPMGLAFDHAGNLLIADSENGLVRRISNPVFITQVNSTIKETAISIYPNPVTDELTITSPDKITNIAITDLLGQAVFTGIYSAGHVVINVAMLPAGVYLIAINGSEVRRFVKE